MKRLTVLGTALAITYATWSCGSGTGRQPSGDESAKARSAGGGGSGGVDLTGAGATFPNPIYAKWFHDYAAKTGVRINYQSIGSGGGIRQLQEQTVDFGASDAPMSDSEMVRAKGGPILHIPTVVGVVAVAYNLPGLAQPIKLTGSLVADIFLGKVTKWNDSRIAAVNAGAALPAKDILVVHRSEGSGTTYVFSDYLSAVSPMWKSGPGRGKGLQWPVGLGGKGNEGVSGQIKQTPGAVGYVELAYVKPNGLSVALIQNADGQFVAPAADAATAAADAAAAKLPPNTDYRVSIVNSPGAQTYPIASFTWLLVYKNQPDPIKAKKLTDFIRWALSDGQKDAAALDYAPLPASLASRLTTRLDSLSPRPVVSRGGAQ
ncbi:MAG TPA: phosphate ABC transporter substrate-binding protein PstS [Gemmatimonadaceae bacterium]